jgi:hypothetical protein
MQSPTSVDIHATEDPVARALLTLDYVIGRSEKFFSMLAAPLALAFGASVWKLADSITNETSLLISFQWTVPLTLFVAALVIAPFFAYGLSKPPQSNASPWLSGHKYLFAVLPLAASFVALGLLIATGDLAYAGPFAYWAAMLLALVIPEQPRERAVLERVALRRRPKAQLIALLCFISGAHILFSIYAWPAQPVASHDVKTAVLMVLSAVLFALVPTATVVIHTISRLENLRARVMLGLMPPSLALSIVVNDPLFGLLEPYEEELRQHVPPQKRAD